MAKASGVGWTNLSVDDITLVARNIRNDCTNLNFATPRAADDVTGLDKLSVERVLLLGDFTITMNGAYNPAAAGAHQTLKHITSSAVVRTTTLEVNSAIMPNEVLYTDYSLARAQGGALTWSATGSLADGTIPTWN